MPLKHYDIVYENRKISAPMDYARSFYGSFDCECLDAPELIPAGSTQFNEGTSEPFSVTSWTGRPRAWV